MDELPAAAKALLGSTESRPLGAIQVQSNLTSMAEYQAIEQAARNLLVKACRKLEAGDTGAADGYIRRTIALPFEDDPEHYLALDAAHYLLSDEVVDALEEAEPGDIGWLDRALEVLDECGEVGGIGLKRALQGAGDYELTADERKRIKAVVGNLDHEKALEAFVSSGELSLLEVMRQVLWTAVLYQRSAE